MIATHVNFWLENAGVFSQSEAGVGVDGRVSDGVTNGWITFAAVPRWRPLREQ